MDDLGSITSHSRTFCVIAFMAILLMNMLPYGNQFMPLNAEAQGLQLRVSAEERPQFQNHFFGPQIVQVVIDDPNSADPGDSTVGLQIKDTTQPRVHLGDGLWYSYFAEQAIFLLLLDVVTDGIRDTNIAVRPRVGGADASHPATVAGFTINFASAFSAASPVREVTLGGGTIFVEVDRATVFLTLPVSVDNAANTQRTLGDSNTGGAGISTDATETTVALDSDWPFIELISMNELDQVSIRAGSASVTLTYDDLNDSISSIIDRLTAYPVNAEVIISYTDFMWNINPVEEDVVNWVLDKTTGNPTGVFYQFNRNHAIAFNANNQQGLLGILFRPNLLFDTRQVLELDSEGITTMKFYDSFNTNTGAIGSVVNLANPPQRVAENTKLSTDAAFADPLRPVIKMIESEPNTSFFESIDGQQGSRSDLFTGIKDRVANFDYFDIINSAKTSTHDGFVSVDKEMYHSADRALFTVADADQNLRSRASEQPPARESKALVKVGKPFPLSNNPSLANLFPTSDPNKHTLKHITPPAGSTFDIDSIEAASFLLVNDVSADVTTNPSIRDIVNFIGGDVAATRNGVTATLNDFFLNTDDVASTSPSDSQLIALQFNNPDIVPGGTFDKASGIIINSAVRLQDLNSFERLTLTKGQILRDATAVAGSTPGAVQAFNIDPFLSSVSIYRTTGAAPATVTDVTALAGNPTLGVFFPTYNLMQIDLAGLNIGLEDGSVDSLNNVAVQVEAFRDLNLNGKLDTLAELGTTRRTMVDFNPFQAADTDGDGIRAIANLGNTRIGVGSFRVIDLMNFDWDGDGKTVFDGDTDDLRTTAAGPILLRISVVFVDNNIPAEPVEVLQPGSQIAVIDFSGIGAIVTQDPNGSGNIDQINLNTFHNMVYRIQVKEQDSNSSMFTGRMDFMTANQFDTTERALQDIVLQGDPAKAWMPNRFIPPNRLEFSYSDVDVIQSFKAVSATYIYETTDGKIFWNSKAYRPQSRAILTLEDEDLNRKPDAVERYDLPLSGFIFIELGKKRVDDTCAKTVTTCFLSHVDASLRETGPDTGIFQAQIDMPPRLRLADGTVVNTNRDDLEINYIDVRDRSSIRQEFEDVTNIRTKVGTVLLDRNVYPQGPRLAPNTPLFGAIMYIEIHKGFFTQDPDLRDIFDLTKTVDFSTESGKANDIRDTFEIKIYNGGGNNPVIYSANPASSIKNGGKEFPILDRNQNEVKQALESGPNTNIYELEFMIYCPDSVPELKQLLDAPVCTDTVLNSPSFKANSPIEVIFNDPQDNSGTPEEVHTFAVIQGVTAQLGTDKIEYDVGDPVTFFMIEPDFNFDSRAVEEADFNFVGVTTDRTPVDELPLQILLNALQALGSFSSSLQGFRESGNNTGIFGAISKPGVLDTLVANRGSKIELVYRDSTPSGGGSAVRIEHDVFLKANTPEIIFDKEEYTPFDEVTVTIVSIDSNSDSFQIDTIRPLVSTSSDTGFRLKMPETGVDSRTFEQDIKITPDKSKFLGDLVANREDGLTVEFRIDAKTVVTKSVFINYHVGNLMFDQDQFRIDDRVILRVIDPDENKNPDTVDTIDVRLWSTTDRGGLLITLRETGDRTGIFEEFLTFTTDEESSGTRLRVSEGDTITTKYTDRTLPAPASLDKDGIFTVKVEELFASALIGSTGPPLERVRVTGPVIVDQNSLPLDQVEVDKQVLIQSAITNNQNTKQKFVYIVQIKDSGGNITSLSYVSGELPANDSIAAAQSWIPARKDSYKIEVFVWESIDNPTALAPVRMASITVS